MFQKKEFTEGHCLSWPLGHLIHWNKHIFILLLLDISHYVSGFNFHHVDSIFFFFFVKITIVRLNIHLQIPKSENVDVYF